MTTVTKMAAFCWASAFTLFAPRPSDAAGRVPDPQRSAAIEGEMLATAAVRLTLCENERRRDAADRMIAEARSAVAPHQQLRLPFNKGYQLGRETELLLQGEDYFRAQKCEKWEERVRSSVERVIKLVTDYEYQQLTK